MTPSILLLALLLQIYHCSSQVFHETVVPVIAHPPNQVFIDKRFGVSLGPGMDLLTGDVIVLTIEDTNPIDGSPIFNVWAQSDNGDIICIDPIETSNQQQLMYAQYQASLRQSSTTQQFQTFQRRSNDANTNSLHEQEKPNDPVKPHSNTTHPGHSNSPPSSTTSRSFKTFQQQPIQPIYNSVNPQTSSTYAQYGVTQPIYGTSYYSEAWSPSLVHMFTVNVIDGRLGLISLSPVVVFPNSPIYITAQPPTARSGVGSFMDKSAWETQTPHNLAVNQFIPTSNPLYVYGSAFYDLTTASAFSAFQSTTLMQHQFDAAGESMMNSQVNFPSTLATVQHTTVIEPSQIGYLYLRPSSQHGFAACSLGKLRSPYFQNPVILTPNQFNIDPIWSRFKVTKIPPQVVRALMANYIDSVTSGLPRSFIMLVSSPFTDRIAAIHFHAAEALLSVRRLFLGTVRITTRATKLEQQLSALMRSLISDSIRFTWNFAALLEPQFSLGVTPVVPPVDPLQFKNRDTYSTFGLNSQPTNDKSYSREHLHAHTAQFPHDFQNYFDRVNGNEDSERFDFDLDLDEWRTSLRGSGQNDNDNSPNKPDFDRFSSPASSTVSQIQTLRESIRRNLHITSNDYISINDPTNDDTLGDQRKLLHQSHQKVLANVLPRYNPASSTQFPQERTHDNYNTSNLPQQDEPSNLSNQQSQISTPSTLPHVSTPSLSNTPTENKILAQFGHLAGFQTKHPIFPQNQFDSLSAASSGMTPPETSSNANSLNHSSQPSPNLLPNSRNDPSSSPSNLSLTAQQVSNGQQSRIPTVPRSILKGYSDESDMAYNHYQAQLHRQSQEQHDSQIHGNDVAPDQRRRDQNLANSNKPPQYQGLADDIKSSDRQIPFKNQNTENYSHNNNATNKSPRSPAYSWLKDRDHKHLTLLSRLGYDYDPVNANMKPYLRSAASNNPSSFSQQSPHQGGSTTPDTPSENDSRSVPPGLLKPNYMLFDTIDMTLGQDFHEEIPKHVQLLSKLDPIRRKRYEERESYPNLDAELKRTSSDFARFFNPDVGNDANLPLPSTISERHGELYFSIAKLQDSGGFRGVYGDKDDVDIKSPPDLPPSASVGTVGMAAHKLPLRPEASHLEAQKLMKIQITLQLSFYLSLHPTLPLTPSNLNIINTVLQFYHQRDLALKNVSIASLFLTTILVQQIRSELTSPPFLYGHDLNLFQSGFENQSRNQHHDSNLHFHEFLHNSFNIALSLQNSLQDGRANTLWTYSNMKFLQSLFHLDSCFTLHHVTFEKLHEDVVDDVHLQSQKVANNSATDATQDVDQNQLYLCPACNHPIPCDCSRHLNSNPVHTAQSTYFEWIDKCAVLHTSSKFTLSPSISTSYSLFAPLFSSLDAELERSPSLSTIFSLQSEPDASSNASKEPNLVHNYNLTALNEHYKQFRESFLTQLDSLALSFSPQSNPSTSHSRSPTDLCDDDPHSTHQLALSHIFSLSYYSTPQHDLNLASLQYLLSPSTSSSLHNGHITDSHETTTSLQHRNTQSRNRFQKRFTGTTYGPFKQSSLFVPSEEQDTNGKDNHGAKSDKTLSTTTTTSQKPVHPNADKAAIFQTHMECSDGDNSLNYKNLHHKAAPLQFQPDVINVDTTTHTLSPSGQLQLPRDNLGINAIDLIQGRGIHAIPLDSQHQQREPSSTPNHNVRNVHHPPKPQQTHPPHSYSQHQDNLSPNQSTPDNPFMSPSVHTMKTAQMIPGLVEGLAFNLPIVIAGGIDADFGTVQEMVGEYALLAAPRSSNRGHLVQAVSYSKMPFSIDLSRYEFYWYALTIAECHIPQKPEGVRGTAAFFDVGGSFEDGVTFSEFLRPSFTSALGNVNLIFGSPDSGGKSTGMDNDDLITDEQLDQRVSNQTQFGPSKPVFTAKHAGSNSKNDTRGELSRNAKSRDEIKQIVQSVASSYRDYQIFNPSSLKPYLPTKPNLNPDKSHTKTTAIKPQHSSKARWLELGSTNTINSLLETPSQTSQSIDEATSNKAQRQLQQQQQLIPDELKLFSHLIFFPTNSDTYLNQCPNFDKLLLAASQPSNSPQTHHSSFPSTSPSSPAGPTAVHRATQHSFISTSPPANSTQYDTFSASHQKASTFQIDGGFSHLVTDVDPTCMDTIAFENALDRFTADLFHGQSDLWSVTNPVGLYHPAMELHHFAITGTYEATNTAFFEFIIEKVGF